MLGNGLGSDKLYQEMQALISPMGFNVVDVVRNEQHGSTQLLLTVCRPDKDVDTDDLAEVYNIVYPRYQVILGDRDLTLEVSSPGLQRNFKDVLEFSLFTGRRVKAYSVSRSSYVEGVIKSADADSVVLVDALVVDKGEALEEIRLMYEDVSKAKLTYRWEEEKR